MNHNDPGTLGVTNHWTVGRKRSSSAHQGAAGIDSYQVALRSSTHLEWTYIPYILPASSEGGTGGPMHYTLAWFDRYLKGGPEVLPATERLAQRADARRRLLGQVRRVGGRQRDRRGDLRRGDQQQRPPLAGG